jgi:hypothetical protein
MSRRASPTVAPPDANRNMFDPARPRRTTRPLPFAGLNKTRRQQLYDRGAHIWTNEYGVGYYLEAGLRAPEEAVVSVPTYYNHSLKNGIWRRVSALSKPEKAIDILGPEGGDDENPNTQAPHDNPCHTTYEANEQHPPLNPISATAPIRRGVGRKGKCGRKRKVDRVPMAKHKDKKTKGADNHKVYKETIKSVLMRVVETAIECDQYVRAAATQAQATLFKDYNITISRSWCRALILTYMMTGNTCAHSPKDLRYSNSTRDLRAYRRRCAARPQHKAPCFPGRCDGMIDTPYQGDRL